MKSKQKYFYFEHNIVFLLDFLIRLYNSLVKVDFPEFDKPVKNKIKGVVLIFSFVKNYIRIYTSLS